MKAQSSRNLHGTSTWHINMDWISEHCRLWTANLGSLERDLGHADAKCYIAFYHYWINRVGWDPLEYLAWIPFATPEGSRKLFMDPMSYLPVLWGLVLFKILGYPGCLVLFEFLMWFVKKEPRISCLPKWNRTTAGTGLVKLCFCQQYKRTNLNNLNYGDEVNNAIKHRWTLLWPCPHWSVLSCRLWAGGAELQWWQQSPNCSNLICFVTKRIRATCTVWAE